MTKEELEASKHALETEKLEREIAKLKSETAAIDKQQSMWGQAIEWAKALAGVAAVVTVIVALFSLRFSASRWQDELEQSRQVKAQEQIAKAFENLSTESVAKRLSGLASVRAFLTERNDLHHRLILDVSVSLLAVEKERQVRDSMVSMLKGLDTSIVSKRALDSALIVLVDASRTLVNRENLYLNRYIFSRSLPPNSNEAIAKSVGDAIVTLLRLGGQARDLSGIYCVQCDFTNLVLPQINFSNSILYLSDFSNATLSDANFNGADLEHTNFRTADLQGATLTLTKDQIRGHYLPSYVSGIFRRGEGSQILMHGPDFSCADLRKADFSGHPVFGFASTKAGLANGAPALILVPASFVGVDLEGTKFGEAKMFGARSENEILPWPTDGPDSGTESASLLPSRLFEFDFSKDDDHGPGREEAGDLSGYDKSFAFFQQGFAGSNWRSAIFPSKVRSWLEAHTPPTDLHFGTRSPCEPRRPLSKLKSKPGKGK